MAIRKMKYEDLPSPLDALTVIQERHVYAVNAYANGLDEREVRLLSEMSDRHDILLGRRAYVLLTAQHSTHVIDCDDPRDVWENTLHSFAAAMAAPYRNQNECVLAWWRAFVGEIDAMVNGKARVTL